MKTKVAIIGAGPAGLTAGYLLSKEAVDVVVLEADPVYVGGISRTVTYKDFHFDIEATVSSQNQKRSKICGRRFYRTTCSCGHVRRAFSMTANFTLIRSNRSKHW